VSSLSTANVEQAIEAMAAKCNNWGRWGEDDALGTMNFIDETKRREAAELARNGRTFSLALRYDGAGPQNGWRNRVNPVHTMLTTGRDATAGTQGFPHGFGGSDDCVFMPLQCGTQWDGLGHIFDHGRAWNGRDASEVVDSEGDHFTGMEHAATAGVTRGVLLDAGRVLGSDGELPDGFAITPDHLQEIIDVQGSSAAVRRGDIVLLRTGHLTRALRDGWQQYAGGDAPGVSFSAAPWLYESQIAGLATDTWGAEVRPNEFEGAWQPLHQVMIPHIGLWVGEMWLLDELAASCADDGVYEFLLIAPPLPFTGAVGSPLNPIAIK
jgi:kynurenine formamidase